jgi:hypothetical protein
VTTPTLDYPVFPGPVPCARVDPELFFPAGPADLRGMQNGAEVCARCPFRAPCAAYAARRHETGVWGGRYFTRGRSRPIPPRDPSALHCEVHEQPACSTTYKRGCRCGGCRAWQRREWQTRKAKRNEGAA